MREREYLGREDRKSKSKDQGKFEGAEGTDNRYMCVWHSGHEVTRSGRGD